MDLIPWNIILFYCKWLYTSKKCKTEYEKATKFHDICNSGSMIPSFKALEVDVHLN